MTDVRQDRDRDNTDERTRATPAYVFLECFHP